MFEHETPQHYAVCRFTCEPADLTQYLPHPLGSAVEYILRAPFKGHEADDLSKAAYWLRRFADDDEWCEPCEDGPDFIWVYRGHMPQYFRACAAAMCAQAYRLDRIFRFQGKNVAVSRNAVEELVEELEARVKELKGEP